MSLEIADGSQGWADGAPYDVIVFTGSLPLLPVIAEQQLATNGRLFAVVGEGPAMEATMIRRVSADSFRHDVLFETSVPPLENAPHPARFEF